MNSFSNEPVLRFFEEISRIPRGSGNEKVISDYMVNFAKVRNLEVIQDKAMNVIIKKPGTKGYENAPIVILQGHLDMVCDKNKETVHDFEKDPIELRVEGDMLYAKNTTLGADNGIALAYAMEILDSDKIPHPPIEVLFTTNEETGVDGASTLDPHSLKGKYLINIDSEEEGRILVSCAGGMTVIQSLPAEWENADESLLPYIISIRGLKGGHSGAEIHLGRGNSNKLMGRLLQDISRSIEYSLAEINGGLKVNAIPREADAVIMINPKGQGKLTDKIDEWNKIFKNELRASDSGINITAKIMDVKVERVFSKDITKKVTASLVLIPEGVQTMSMEIEGLVESSTNPGVVKTTDTMIVIESAVRSSVRTLKHYIMNQCKTLAEYTGAEFIVYTDYPEWEYNPESNLRKIFEKVYEEKYGNKPEVVALHAGLECGIFKEKMPDLDMISFGPNLYDAHTPNEHMSISSSKRTWEYLLDVLKEIK